MKQVSFMVSSPNRRTVDKRLSAVWRLTDVRQLTLISESTVNEVIVHRIFAQSASGWLNRRGALVATERFASWHGGRARLRLK